MTIPMFKINPITTANIDYAPIPHLITERNRLIETGFKTVGEVLHAVIEERIEDLEAKANDLEALKEKHIQNESFEMLGIVRRESEYLQTQIIQLKIMADIYHIFSPITLQMSMDTEI